MGAVSHFIEAEGVPTAGISLVREHTERMRPPRALWVSFELGRPLGPPHDAALQMRVLKSLLGLLERTDGPSILEDFPEDAPPMTAEEMEGMVCPVPLPRPRSTDGSGLLAAVRGEMETLAPWHALAVEKAGGRSLVGVSGLEIAEVLSVLDRMLSSRAITAAGTLTPAQTLRYATEDLRNWYLEAASAKPGGNINSTALAEWFWGATAAGRLILSLHPIGLASDDALVLRVTKLNLIPRLQQHRIAEDNRLS